MICHKLANYNIIQFHYCILLTAKNLKKFDNYYNISKKGFTTAEIIQLMELIIIIYIPSLFNPLKIIGAVFYFGLYNLDIKL